MLTIDDNFLYVSSILASKSRLEALGGVWNVRTKSFRFPRNLRCLQQLGEQFPRLVDTEVYQELEQRFIFSQQTFLSYRRYQAEHEFLRPYQVTDLFYLEKLQHGAIFNEPRTGKTIIAIQLAERIIEEQGGLVICPASLVLNWCAEFEKWNSFVKPFTNFLLFSNYQGKKVFVVSKDTWKKQQANILDYHYDVCFVDEAHYLRNYKSQQSKSVFKVQAKRKYVLTGTPTVKHTSDIWGILHFLYPKKFTSYWQFVNRYFTIETDYFGHQHIGKVKKEYEVELQELIGFISVQRKRAEVMQWLPPKVYQTLYCEMGKKQRKMYDQLKEEFFISNEQDEILLDTENVLAQLTRLRQVCLDPNLVDLDASSSKTEALLDWLDDNPQPVVIMSMFTSYLKKLFDVLRHKGYKVAAINGEMSTFDKQQSANDFQAGKVDILLCNIISAGTGFTLDKADTIIFTDKAWNPSDNEQAEDRITPTTEERNHSHTIISLICKNSFDESLHTMLQSKKSLTDVINEGGRKAIKNLLRGE